MIPSSPVLFLTTAGWVAGFGAASVVVWRGSRGQAGLLGLLVAVMWPFWLPIYAVITQGRRAAPPSDDHDDEDGPPRILVEQGRGGNHAWAWVPVEPPMLPPEPPATLTGVLDAAADLLSNPYSWVQDSVAEDADGDCLGDYPGRAFTPVRWSMDGAINQVRGVPLDTPLTSEMITAIHAVIGATNVFDWNNKPQRTRIQVVAVLREAARYAEQMIPVYRGLDRLAAVSMAAPAQGGRL